MQTTTVVDALGTIVVGLMSVVAVVSILIVVGSDSVCCLVSATANAGHGRTRDGLGTTA